MNTTASDNPSISGRRQRWIPLLGLVVSTVTLALVLVGLSIESSYLWREGFATYASEVASRVGFGAVLAVFTFLPYGMLYMAASRTRFGRAALVAACVIFAIDAWVHALIFLSGSSTAPIGLLFLPFWLAISAACIWMVLELLEAHFASKELV